MKEPTLEEVMLYCRRRNMSLITNEALAHIQATNGWIPTTIALPQQGMLVLATYDDSVMMAYLNGDGVWMDINGYELEYVKAFMYFPAPYIEET